MESLKKNTTKWTKALTFEKHLVWDVIRKFSSIRMADPLIS